MKFSMQWLQKLVAVKTNTDTIGEQLTAAGLEVETIVNDVFDVSIPPNRADCLGMVGVAREVAALNAITFTVPAIKDVAASIKDNFSLTVKDSKACPKYLGRIIKGIDNARQTPQWIKDCLTHADIKIISPVVDITNYVMLEWGQPMHAFALNKISDAIVVRHANKGEVLELLDDTKQELTPQTLVIADNKKPLAMAGIMGGKESGIAVDTKDILLECAYFEPIAIRLTSRHYGIKTESSYRFERCIDPTMQEKVIEHATQMILDIVGGSAGPLVAFRDAAELPKPEKIVLRSERITKILGITLTSNQITEILERIGFTVSNNDQGKTFMVEVPPFRTDVTREIDLIEELVRIHGYAHIPVQSNVNKLEFLAQPEEKLTETQILTCLANRGYNEAITYSFIDSEFAKLFTVHINEDLCLANPISAEMNLMRFSLLPALLKTVQYNQNRQQDRVRLFEIGLRFIGEAANIQQLKTIAGVCYGPKFPEGWANPKQLVDLFDIKADVQALFALAHNAGNLSFQEATDPAMHPGQCAHILLNGRMVGKIGALHPELQQHLELPSTAYMFEIDYAALVNGRIASFEMFSKYPAVRRDIALLVAQNVSAAKLQQAIRDEAGGLLQNLVLFDVYQGKGIPEGQKSMALGLTLQQADRTLTDTEVNDLFNNIVTMLQREFNAVLR